MGGEKERVGDKKNKRSKRGDKEGNRRGNGGGGTKGRGGGKRKGEWERITEITARIVGNYFPKMPRRWGQKVWHGEEREEKSESIRAKIRKEEKDSRI